jgi:OFA family oxalate/formate antiporter-like MFS transporter
MFFATFAHDKGRCSMKSLDRRVYAAVGIVVLLGSGLVYAWSVLQAPIAAAYPDWTKGQLSLTFTITMFCFCIGGFAGGMLQRRWRPRVLVWASAALFLAGFSLASSASSLVMLYLGFGVLAGLGSGLAYNAALSSVLPWFPDKQGLISGVLLMGFGISSFAVGKAYTALTPSDGGFAWRGSLMAIGVVLAVVMALAGFLVEKPGRGWRAPGKASRRRTASYEEVPSTQMVRRPSFWLFMVWTTLLSAAGLAIVSQGSPLAQEAIPGISMGTVATLAGLISVFNGVGRILSGAMFDGLGRAKTMLASGALFVVAMLLVILSLTSHSMPLLVLAFVATGLAYGCVPPINSAFASLFFGQRNYPVNVSIVNLNLLVASFGSTVAGMVVDATKSYVTVAVIVIVAVVAGTVAGWLIREPRG